MDKEIFRNAMGVLLSGVCPGNSGYYQVRTEYQGRPYHSWTHIRQMWAHAFRDALLIGINEKCWARLVLAIAFHDVIYNTNNLSVDLSNEELSAQMAEKYLGQRNVDDSDIAEIVRLIMLTKTHKVEDDDVLGRIMIDADLAILAAPDLEYDTYADNIRKEYDWVEESAYIQGRVKFLESFLKRERLFYTTNLSDAQARRNMTRELYRLNSHLGAG